ncbi:MAG: ISL3 family transposase [Anaerovoracaceae bacterium]
MITEALDSVDRNCFISNETRRSIVSSLRKTGSLSSIATTHNVSYPSVYRALEKVEYHSAPKELPEVLSFDEFKANTNEGKYAFVAIDPVAHKIIEILGDRKYSSVYSFFSKYPEEERLKVKFVVSDLWRPYLKIAKTLFPNATFVADKFHYQRLVNNAFNSVRKNISEKLDPSVAYQVKKYWKLLNKKESRLYCKEQKYSHWLKRPVLQTELVQSLIDVDNTLNEAYQLYQEFLTLINLKNESEQKKLFDTWLDKASTSNIKEMNNAAKSLKTWSDGIKASFVPYNGKTLNNGTIEGFNNRIKVIKRVSYGYRSFINFKKRILLSFF